jgi:hypothetical protein
VGQAIRGGAPFPGTRKPPILTNQFSTVVAAFCRLKAVDSSCRTQSGHSTEAIRLVPFRPFHDICSRRIRAPLVLQTFN